MKLVFNYVKDFIENLFKPKIIFYSKVPFLTVANTPIETKKEFSEIIKKVMPVFGKYNTHSQSIKKCPGIIEYGKAGYILRAWQDIAITTCSSGDTFEWEMDDLNYFFNGDKIGKDVITWFPQELYFNHFPRKNTLKPTLKINTPWYVSLPKGYKLLYAPVWYDNEERFTVVPGILDPDLNDNLKVIIYWHSLGKTEVIKAGTPLVRLIPIKIEKWKAYVKEASDDIIKKSDSKIIKHYNGPQGRF